MAAINLSNEDLFTDGVDPNATVNPKKRGSIWINNVTGEMFACINNTANQNQWVQVVRDKWRDLGNAIGTYNLTFGGENNIYNNFWINLTGPTSFGTVNASGAAERSGLLVVRNGGRNLNRFFINVYYSFTVPILSAPNNSNNGQYLIFPYKILPTGLVVFTRC